MLRSFKNSLCPANKISVIVIKFCILMLKNCKTRHSTKWLAFYIVTRFARYALLKTRFAFQTKFFIILTKLGILFVKQDIEQILGLLHCDSLRSLHSCIIIIFLGLCHFQHCGLWIWCLYFTQRLQSNSSWIAVKNNLFASSSFPRSLRFRRLEKKTIASAKTKLM